MTADPRRPETKRARQRRERRDPFTPQVPRDAKRAMGPTTATETPLHVRALGPSIDDELRAYVHQRVGFRLGKFALAITRVSVRFEKLSGDRATPTWECRIKVVLRSGADVVLAATAQESRAAFDAASNAVERAVRRAVERRETARTRAPRALAGR